jgi:hypothetical protein
MTNLKKNELDQSFYLRRLQQLKDSRVAVLTIASPYVKALRLSAGDEIMETFENGRIVLQKCSIRRQTEDGVVA